MYVYSLNLILLILIGVVQVLASCHQPTLGNSTTMIGMCVAELVNSISKNQYDKTTLFHT